MFPARPFHRIRQFVRAARARTPVVEADLGGILSPAERELFFAMSPADQHHSLAVMRYLVRRGHDDPVVWRAALLHDVGKAAAPIRLWHRVAFVLLGAVAPGAREMLARRSIGWRGGFFALAHHQRIGAAVLRGAGADPAIVALVGGTSLPEDRRRRLLEEADEGV